MSDKSSLIFNNPIDKKTLKKASKSKKKYLKKFGDDSKTTYHLAPRKIETLSYLDADNLVLSKEAMKFDDKALIVGNIRMGFGHYRISIAMASAAKALGYHPYWLDLASFDATGSKMIRHQNNLYSLASKISQRSKLFNHFFWEPLNSEGFKKITYNATDQKNSELLVPLYHDIPKDIPYIATHVWPSQGAVHAGLTHVVNAIPDNWPMGLHLSEGAIHTVQTPFAYLGYKTLDGFAKDNLNGIPEKDLFMVGRYIDHELLVDLKGDNNRRVKRIKEDKPLRILLTVGGAGAGFKLFYETINHLLPYVKAKKVALLINFGDHLGVYKKLTKKLDYKEAKTYFNEYSKLLDLANKIKDGDLEGVHYIYNEDIFEAVYSTNLLIPVSDLLITKPSELAYYPIPKIFMRHIGGHEVYGAINARELGDALDEYPTSKKLNKMLDKILADKEILEHLVKRIDTLQEQGAYDGAYKCVELAVKGKLSSL